MTIEHDDGAMRRSTEGAVDTHGMATQRDVLAHKRLRMIVDISIVMRDITSLDVTGESHDRVQKNDDEGSALDWEQARAHRAFLHALTGNEVWLEEFVRTCLSGLIDEGGELAEKLRKEFHVNWDRQNELFMAVASSLTPRQNGFFIDAEQNDRLADFLELVLNNVQCDVDVSATITREAETGH